MVFTTTINAQVRFGGQKESAGTVAAVVGKA